MGERDTSRAHGDVDEVDPLPAQNVGDEAAKEQSRSPTPRGHRRPGGHSAVSLSALGEDGGDDRERSRGGGRRSKPLESARDHHHLLGDREAATKGSRREDGKPHDEGLPPTPQVRHPPRQEQEARKEQHVSRDHPLQTRLRENPRSCPIECRATITAFTSNTPTNCATHNRISAASLRSTRVWPPTSTTLLHT